MAQTPSKWSHPWTGHDRNAPRSGAAARIPLGPGVARPNAATPRRQERGGATLGSSLSLLQRFFAVHNLRVHHFKGTSWAVTNFARSRTRFRSHPGEPNPCCMKTLPRFSVAKPIKGRENKTRTITADVVTDINKTTCSLSGLAHQNWRVPQRNRAQKLKVPTPIGSMHQPAQKTFDSSSPETFGLSNPETFSSSQKLLVHLPQKPLVHLPQKLSVHLPQKLSVHLPQKLSVHLPQKLLVHLPRNFWFIYPRNF